MAQGAEPPSQGYRRPVCHPAAISLIRGQEDIAKLLRFESSALPAGQQTNLQEYASRMKAGTRNIYYLCAPNRHLVEQSPYFEAMKKKEMEVRVCLCLEAGCSGCPVV